MAKREFLLLAQNYNPAKHGICGWYLSEKLDGLRCFWDGGITRGLPCEQVPWANTTKHARLKVSPVATGLWTRYGQPFRAPHWFLDSMPERPLDGELTMGRGMWEETSSCCKSFDPDDRWEKVKYAVFDSPSFQSVFADGRINNENFKKEIRGSIGWITRRFPDHVGLEAPKPFYATLDILKKEHALGDFAHLVEQIKLPGTTPQAKEVIEQQMESVLAVKGEGLMLRSPISVWHPSRNNDLLKVKSYEDAEATVIGYVWADKTDTTRNRTGIETNKLLGLMGSLICQMPDGNVFNLSGFTDDERRMAFWTSDEDATEHGKERPGQEAGSNIYNPKFPRGSKVTYRFRELTNDGKPKEARFLRKAEVP